MTKRKSKGKRGSTADFEFGEWPFLDGVPGADAADAARYRWLRDNKAANNDHCWHFQSGPIIPRLLSLDAAIDAVMKAAT